ncbi:hypothetical protein AALP_AA1G315900 [Arabis alpina]|uniref:F-box domain-containing protein n=1 Tax=Arabis alpina TaxID=50452 RepID=A0A087HRY6_ARAAL|nr:hypothetical protein AALP_AA1G315900 [Arabis alpina]
MMKNWIPNDVIIEILSRLPAKSTARFRCVSKQWRSTLCRQDFKELFLTRSSARPRLLISVKKDDERNFFLSSLSQNPYEKSSLVVAAEFLIKFSKDMSQYPYSYASGLIYIPRADDDTKRVICNPITGQYVTLPELRKVYGYSYLGFDPIDKEFKVLLMNTPYDYIAPSDAVHYIWTLGSGNLGWRKIQCPFTHEPFYYGRICINGVLYYLALHSQLRKDVIVCFDVRSEKFNFIEAHSSCGFSTIFINYKGKLGGITYSYDRYSNDTHKLCMWVLEDVEKQEWSTYVYSLRNTQLVRNRNTVVKVDWKNLSVAGMTATGEIVLSPNVGSCEPFYVLYFSLERNTLQRVEIHGVGANRDRHVHCYVEDLSVIDAMQLKSIPVKQGQNMVTKRPKPQQRRHTSRDVTGSAPSVKNKQQNMYGLSANLLYHSFALSILFFVSFILFVILFSSIILFS